MAINATEHGHVCNGHGHVCKNLTNRMVLRVVAGEQRRHYETLYSIPDWILSLRCSLLVAGT